MKKFISLFLVLSILLLSGNLFARERKGADLVIQKTDGTQIRGELIAVKENSLLLLERDSGADVTVDIHDIRVITIVGKSKAFGGAVRGLFIGACVGAIVGLVADKVIDKEDWVWGPEHSALLGGGIGGAAGAIGGGLIGASAGKNVTFQIEGKSDAEIKEILEKLRKKARVRSFQ